MSTESETLYTEKFHCDGGCGSSVELLTQDPNGGNFPKIMLEAIGWRFVSDDEGYCPKCAIRVEKAGLCLAKTKGGDNV